MPAATPIPPVTVVGRPSEAITYAILARLATLNQTDPTIAALLTEFQTVTGKPFGSGA